MASQDERGKEFAEVFGQFVNTMGGGPDRKIAIEAMMRDHRTLQQGMMRFCIEYIEAMAEQSHDLRNEASVKLAKKIVKIEDRHLPMI